MLSTVLNNIKQLDFPPQTEPSHAVMTVHLVNRNDIVYHKGRILAENVYRQVWNTENHLDDNDYAAVLFYGNRIVGNMNLQIKKTQSLLKSEIFFGANHWQSYHSNVMSDNLAEISGLSIAQDLPANMRKPTLMLLILGNYLLTQVLGINFLTTVQHDLVHRLLTKNLYLPFVENQIITTPQKNIPNDNYWRSSKSPKIYYFNIKDSQAISLAHSFFTYLNLIGIDFKFSSRLSSSITPSFSFLYQNMLDKE